MVGVRGSIDCEFRWSRASSHMSNISLSGVVVWISLIRSSVIILIPFVGIFDINVIGG